MSLENTNPTIERINGWTIITDRLSNGDLFKRRFMGLSKAECLGRFTSEKKIIEKELELSRRLVSCQ